jgi:hypothetical protein
MSKKPRRQLTCRDYMRMPLCQAVLNHIKACPSCRALVNELGVCPRIHLFSAEFT